MSGGAFLAVVVAFVVVGAVMLILRRARWFRTDPFDQLRNRYFELSAGTKAEARERLQRHLERLHETHPGQTMEWYLRRVVSELEKDQRL